TGILASPGGSLVLDPPADRGEPGVDACRDRYPLGGRSRWSPAGGRSRGSILAVPRSDATSGGWRIRRDCDQRAESGDVFAPLERGEDLRLPLAADSPVGGGRALSASGRVALHRAARDGARRLETARPAGRAGGFAGAVRLGTQLNPEQRQPRSQTAAKLTLLEFSSRLL